MEVDVDFNDLFYHYLIEVIQRNMDKETFENIAEVFRMDFFRQSVYDVIKKIKLTFCDNVSFDMLSCNGNFSLYLLLRRENAEERILLFACKKT